LPRKNRIGIGFTGSPYTATQVADLARSAEKSGFDSLWIAEDYYLRDSITLLSCAAYATSSIELGAGVVNPFTRHPALIAQTAATLDELSKGRFSLGLGTGDPESIGFMLGKIRRPLRSMRESVQIVRVLLKGKRANFQGSDFRLTNAKLGANPYILQSADDDFGKNELDIKIYLAATGPKMLDLAAKIGDGVLLSAGTSFKTASESISILNRSKPNSKRARRFSIAGYLAVCLGKPTVHVKKFVADLVSVWPQNFILSGINQKQVEELRTLYWRKGERTAASLLTKEMIEASVACGSASEIEKKISDYRKAGIEQLILVPLGTRAKDLIMTFAS
jgi:5,10-methylenetetrahydromethanopterin reductase